MKASYLYTPALRLQSLVAKRRQLQADVVVADLEDSTHPNAKEDARRALLEFDFAPLAEVGMELGIRVNTLSSYEGVKDLLLLRELCSRPRRELRYVFLPKIRHARDVLIYRALFDSLPQRVRVCTFIETVEAGDCADEIAQVSDALCFGQADLSAEMYRPSATFLDYARARLCIAAARRGLEAIDTNSFEVKDLAVFEAQCEASRQCGFTAKAAIHPMQVAGINRVFRVSSGELEGYRRLVETYEGGSTGFAIGGDGVLAPPFVAHARFMLGAYRGHPALTGEAASDGLRPVAVSNLGGNHVQR